ncbi:hypothetical protein [Glutamicibacter ardleyensis]|uniref:DUF7210 domain-containing protein n=1 Tax=Glutamicibacter ardleyensis TaxID=225894 RepID=A0ABQ2DVL8_9MICC|nr:hypothetical protein [Glutamicibacter ardleyensis]GGJ74417.1 hypothetical protein GCM10007173_36720 [Glutamicibacter ardleyensis]
MAPTIRMRSLISGSRNGKKWPKPGETLDVPAAEAKQLIDQGIAVSLDDVQTATDTGTVETATVPAGNSSLAALRQSKVDAAEAQKEADEKAKADAEAKEQEAADAKAKADAEAKAKPAPKGKAD